MKRIFNALDTYLFGIDHSTGEFVPKHVQVLYYGFIAIGALSVFGVLLSNLT